MVVPKNDSSWDILYVTVLVKSDSVEKLIFSLQWMIFFTTCIALRFSSDLQEIYG